MLSGVAAYFIYVNVPFFDDTHAFVNELISYMQRVGIETAYWQEVESATDEMIPDFDLTGI